MADAEVATVPMANDARLQTVRFTGDDVTRVVTAEGVVTTIEFGSQEEIKDFAMGDRDAWHVAISGNLLVIKPKDVKADTNLTVFTNRRAHFFALKTTARSARNVAYWVQVQYATPDAVPTEAAAASSASRELAQVQVDLKAARFEGVLNHDYWIVGRWELQPLAMHDNGRQTFLTFAGNQPLPAVFVIEPDGSESLVDFHVEEDTLVLHRVARRILLRRGDLVAGITNNAPLPQLPSSPTGTASDKVQRVIRAPGS
jgi:type IV secretion system protein VirB9